MDLKEKESISELFKSESLSKQDTWFPTLQKTYWVLSQMRAYVKVSTPKLEHRAKPLTPDSQLYSKTSPKRL